MLCQRHCTMKNVLNMDVADHQLMVDSSWALKLRSCCFSTKCHWPNMLICIARCWSCAVCGRRCSKGHHNIYDFMSCLLFSMSLSTPLSTELLAILHPDPFTAVQTTIIYLLTGSSSYAPKTTHPYLLAISQPYDASRKVACLPPLGEVLCRLRSVAACRSNRFSSRLVI
jgi:hypothetical protein